MERALAPRANGELQARSRRAGASQRPPGIETRARALEREPRRTMRERPRGGGVGASTRASRADHAAERLAPPAPLEAARSPAFELRARSSPRGARGAQEGARGGARRAPRGGGWARPADPRRRAGGKPAWPALSRRARGAARRRRRRQPPGGSPIGSRRSERAPGGAGGPRGARAARRRPRRGPPGRRPPGPAAGARSPTSTGRERPALRVGLFGAGSERRASGAPFRSRPPRRADRRPGCAEGASVRLAHDDPRSAARLLAGLLPARPRRSRGRVARLRPG